MVKILPLHGLSQKAFLALSAFFFSACNFENLFEPTYNDGVKDYFKEYTENAAIEEHTLSLESYSDSKGHSCVPSSEGDLVLDYYMRNPQKYILQPSVTFSALEETIDRSGVEIIQSETDHIVLTVPQSLLVDSDEGKNISPTISLLEPKSGRTFRQYSVDLYCNSKPPRLYNPTVLNDNNSTFAIAFDMPSAAELALRHKDLATISINGSSFPLTIDENGNFNFEDSRFTTSPKSSYTAINSKNFVQTSRSVYFATEEAFSADEKSYTLVLSDSAGLTSQTTASTMITKLNKPVIFDSENKEIADGSSVIYEKDYEKNCSEITLVPPSQDHLGNEVEDSTLHYVIYKGTSSVASLYKTGSTKESLTLQLEVGTWYIEAYAEKTNYENSAPAKADIRVIDTSLYISAGGDDSIADGSEELPYATFTAAIAEINSRSISTSNYVFYITGNLTGEEELKDPISASSIVIRGSDSSGGISSLKIETALPLTLKKLSLGSLALSSGSPKLADCTIENLSVANGAEITLSDGVSVTNAETSGSINIEGSAVVTGELKVKDSEGGIITITNELTGETAATITPETYANGTRILSENELLATNYGKFKVKQKTSDTVWGITSGGLLSEMAKRQIAINVYTGESDIAVTKSESANTVTFTAESGFTAFVWKIDDKTPEATGYSGITVSEGILVIDTSSWSIGIYDIYLTAEKDGETYSYHAQIAIN